MAMLRNAVRNIVDRMVSPDRSPIGRFLANILRRHDVQRLGLVDANLHPNSDPLWIAIRDLNSLHLTVKYFGYELARTLSAALPPPTDLVARHVGLASKPSTQADLESDWARYWIAELKVAHIFHRKLWELAYVLQAIHENSHLHAGATGLGFGCGEEPLPSYLASHGVQVTMTDLAPDAAAARGWINTAQHASSIEVAYRPDLVARDLFDRNVKLRYVDMNAIPPDLHGYDFCWSICALEHIGSIRQGLDFIENSLQTLRPGGLAVHTTEFNFLNDKQTIDNWGTVLFQKKHFRDIADRLQRQGHDVAPLDFDVGSKPLDRFIDVPPYQWDFDPGQKATWGPAIGHIKLSVDGFPCTCFGLIVRKR
jgi:2-polyprenyl-3-methyl-5-hydroxy-6-metoxy-1,4-benzoquinol methylase